MLKNKRCLNVVSKCSILKRAKRILKQWKTLSAAAEDGCTSKILHQQQTNMTSHWSGSSTTEEDQQFCANLLPSLGMSEAPVSSLQTLTPSKQCIYILGSWLHFIHLILLIESLDIKPKSLTCLVDHNLKFEKDPTPFIPPKLIKLSLKCTSIGRLKNCEELFKSQLP